MTIDADKISSDGWGSETITGTVHLIRDTCGYVVCIQMRPNR